MSLAQIFPSALNRWPSWPDSCHTHQEAVYIVSPCPYFPQGRLTTRGTVLCPKCLRQDNMHIRDRYRAIHTLSNTLTNHSFRITQSHHSRNRGLSHGPTYWSAPPPQTQLFFPAFQFPKDWIPQLRVAGLGIRLHAQGSRSKDPG